MTAPRLLIPALAPVYAALRPYAWVLVRVIVGLCLVPHGWQKLADLFGANLFVLRSFAGLGLGPFWAWLIALIELVGGLCLVAGFLTRPVAALVLGQMAYAAFVVHWPSGFFWISGGYEYPLMWAVLAAALVIRGGGELSVDARLGREL